MYDAYADLPYNKAAMRERSLEVEKYEAKKILARRESKNGSAKRARVRAKL